MGRTELRIGPLVKITPLCCSISGNLRAERLKPLPLVLEVSLTM